MRPEYIVYGWAVALSFFVAVGLTALVRRLALRYACLDQPGHRKMHESPIPLLGGVAIVATFYLVLTAAFLAVYFTDRFDMDWARRNLLAFLGDQGVSRLIGILLGGLLIFLLGLVDDLKQLTPWLKLIGQIVAAMALVAFGVRIEFFVLSNFWVSAAVTMFWVVLLTNSLNFLDNMDGLCGGVSIIAALSFFLCVQPDDYLVRFLLMVFAGSVGGFLYHNLSPARIFMGDAGSMFNGYVLATVAVLGTYHVQGTATTPGTASHIAAAAPLLALSVPLFDTFSVIYIRWRQGESIMKGDKRHFSHRLVELGMSPRQAVEFIFLVAGALGLGGALLPKLDQAGTIIIIGQTVGVFLLIVLLMNAGRRRPE